MDKLTKIAIGELQDQAAMLKRLRTAAKKDGRSADYLAGLAAAVVSVERHIGWLKGQPMGLAPYLWRWIV